MTGPSELIPALDVTTGCNGPLDSLGHSSLYPINSPCPSPDIWKPPYPIWAKRRMLQGAHLQPLLVCIVHPGHNPVSC